MEEHLEHLQIFFEILRDNGLTINPSKCSFDVSSVKFLGHMVSESGVVPLPRHVEAISGFPRPTDLRQLQRFLGLINFYRRFLPAIAGVLKPLTDLLRGAPKKLLWSSDADQLSKQVAAMARACLQCQRSKVHKHVHLQPEQVEIPHCRFAHVHVDLVGPLPRSAGFSYLLTVLDRTTRWPEAIPLAAVTAADCAAGFFHGWVQRFGLPATITSDRGPQFASSLWSALCSLLNITHVQTTAYHPQANGAVERFHRRLKDALRARTAGADWHAHLPWVLLGIRSAWRENTSFSPAEAVFGAQPVLPGQFLNSPEPPSPTFLQELQRTLNNRPPPPAEHHNRPGPLSLPEELLLTRFVLVRRDGAQPPLSPMYDEPYLVLERSLRFFQNPGGNKTRYSFYSTPETLQIAAGCTACRSPSPRPATHGPSRRLSSS
jgi:hypothetical protein